MDISIINKSLKRIAEGIEKQNEEHIFHLEQFVSNAAEEYSSIWLDIKNVRGFIIPLLEDGSECTETVNLVFKKDTITVKRDPVLIEYLTNRFVNKAK